MFHEMCWRFSGFSRNLYLLVIYLLVGLLVNLCRDTRLAAKQREEQGPRKRLGPRKR